MNATVKDVMTTRVLQAARLMQGKRVEPETSTVGRDIIDSIRHVRGVVAVRDRLSYPPAGRAFSPGPLF